MCSVRERVVFRTMWKLVVGTGSPDRLFENGLFLCGGTLTNHEANTLAYKASIHLLQLTGSILYISKLYVG